MLGSLIRAYKKIAGKICSADQHANFFWNSAEEALLQKKLLGRSALQINLPIFFGCSDL
jgi:hypothetical protein